MWPICNMLWRIGDILPVDEQLAWCLEAGFDGVGLHASPGRAGQWEGVDPETADPRRRRELRAALGRFARCEVHAPFEILLREEDLAGMAARLEPVIDFAGDIGVAVVTVHAELPEGGDAGPQWADTLGALDHRVASRGLCLGLEIVSGFGLVAAWGLAHVGITLDVGHLYGQDDGRRLVPYGTIGRLVNEIGAAIVHLHVHDVEARSSQPGPPLLDHLEVGTGQVDFEDLLRSLASVEYAGALCLEMNPDRVSPEGIRRSRAHLQGIMSRVSGP